LRFFGLYDPEIDLDDLATQLRPHLEPGEVDIAVAVLQEAMDNLPGSKTEGELTVDEFHAVFVSSLPPLLTEKHPLPVNLAPTVIKLFPEKTRILTDYLRAVASSFPAEVESAAVNVLTSGYLTGLQKALVLMVLRDVVALGGDEKHPVALQIAHDVSENEDESWLPRVEAIRVLAQIGDLGRDLFVRVWNRAPAALHADLAVAVATAARDPDATWAIAFRDSLNPDALMQVVLQGFDGAG
jgi:hypothetical protein